MIGRRLGHYRIVEKIGAGGMGVVYRAHDEHLDLKPGNLMLTSKGDLKVLDFGLAKLARGAASEATRTMTQAGTVTGTVPYMAPEQLRAEPMDARTDIWAAGVVLYELATGRRPFRGEIPASLIHAILSRPPEAPSTDNRRVSPGFEQVALKCLEKDPERRYQSAAGLKADLERVATGTVTAAAAAAVVIAVIVGLIVALKQSRGGAGAPIASLAVLPLANMTGDPAQEYFADGMTEALGFGFAPYWDYYPKIRKEVDAALALDPNFAGVHAARGGLLWAERDSRAALEAWRRTFDLDPSDSGALSAYAAGLAKFDAGPEPERMMRKAIELDPLAQFPRCVYKDWLYGQRRYAEAEAQARTTLDLDPHWFWAWDQLWRIHVRQGKLADAQEESRKSWEVVFGETFKPPPGLSWEAYERWLGNYLGGQHRTWVSGFLAANCARRGEKQKALACLETASKEQSVFLSLLDWPDFDSVREDTRFQKVVEDQKLPVAMFCRRPQAARVSDQRHAGREKSAPRPTIL